MAVSTARRSTPAPVIGTTSPVFVIRAGKDAGKMLSNGEWFRAPGEVGQVFRFLGHRRSPGGAEYVRSYGGDASPNARRGFRAFRCDRELVVTKAPLAPKKSERGDE